VSFSSSQTELYERMDGVKGWRGERRGKRLGGNSTFGELPFSLPGLVMGAT
jgi:hypothetical protein